MDEQALRTLENIEKLLRGAMSSAGGRMPSSADKAGQAKKSGADKDAAKTFTAIASSAKDTNDALLGLNKSLVGLNQVVGKTSIGFSTLNTQMAKFMTSLNPVAGGKSPVSESPESQQPGSGSKLIDSLVGYIRAPMNKLAGMAKGLTGSRLSNTNSAKALGLNATAAASAAGELPASKAVTEQAAQIMNRAGKGMEGAIAPVAQDIAKAGTPFGMALGKMAENFAQTGGTAAALGAAMTMVIDVSTKLAGDYLQLARVGLGSMSNLSELSIAALNAGMSLKEYTALVRDNVVVATRQGSLDEFDKLISSADKQLGVMGIFGAEARAFEASLASSSTVLGVRQGDLSSAMAEQIKLFGELQKTTAMSTDQFASFMHKLSDNAGVQKEILGLAPKDRQARLFEIAQATSVGQRLGLTAEASQNLTEALLKARDASVSDRFDDAGAIQSLAAFVGKGAEGNELANLTLLKYLTTEQTARKVELAGSIKEAGAQRVAAAGPSGFADQNAIETLEGNIKGASADLFKAVVPAVLAQESGKAGVNPAFGASVTLFGQAVGNFLAKVDGFNSSILKTVAVGVGGIVSALFAGPMLKSLLGLGGGATAAAATGGTAVVAGEAAETGGMLSKLLAPLSSIKDVAKGFFSSVTDIPKAISSYTDGIKIFAESDGAPAAIKAVFSDTAGALGDGVTSIFTGLKGFTTGFGPIAGLINAAVEMFTGEISTALNPSGGFFNRVGGMITAFFSAIPDMIIDGLSFVFGPSVPFFSDLKNGFGQFVSIANATFKILIKDLIDGIATPFKWLLPADSGLVKMLTGWSNSLEHSSDENFAAYDKLSADHSKTLSSISKENVKSADAATKAAMGATDKTVAAQAKFNDVQYGPQGVEKIIGDAQSLIGQPQVQLPAAVAPAPVNTPDQAAAAAAAAKDTATGSTQPSDMLVALNSILQVMRDNLAAGVRQADNTDALLRASRPGAVFPDSTQLTNQLLKRGYA